MVLLDWCLADVELACLTVVIGKRLGANAELRASSSAG